MSNGTVVRLDVRPSRRSHLAFDAEGVLGELHVKLGQKVSAFHFASFYAALGATVAGAPAELQYDSASIQSAVAGSTLMALRAETGKAALDSAVAARANAFYAKYGDEGGIIALMNQFYAPASAGSKPRRLEDLAKISREQEKLLHDAYKADGRLGVVRSTTSALASITSSLGDSDASTTGLTTGTDSTNGSSTSTTTGADSDTTVSSGETGTTTTSDNSSTTGSQHGTDVGTSTAVATLAQASSGEDDTVSTGEALENQAITNTDYGYRVPSLESRAQNHRSQISLMDESFGQFMANQSLPFLPQVFGNELSMIDLGVRQLQIAYLDTILMSPIDGIVTGVYKGLGDRVRRGDVAVRVEDNHSVYLVGTLVHRGEVRLHDTVSVKTNRFSNPADAVSVSGTVVGVRGHRANDNWWTVAVSCDNLDGAGHPIFPLHYHFDHDDTTVTVS
jgi:hypothetical protein